MSFGSSFVLVFLVFSFCFFFIKFEQVPSTTCHNVMSCNTDPDRMQRLSSCHHVWYLHCSVCLFFFSLKQNH